MESRCQSEREGEVVEAYVTKTRNRKAALKFLRKAVKRHGQPDVFVTDRLPSYRAALTDVGMAERQETGRWLNNRVENSATTRASDAAFPGISTTHDLPGALEINVASATLGLIVASLIGGPVARYLINRDHLRAEPLADSLVGRH